MVFVCLFLCAFISTKIFPWNFPIYTDKKTESIKKFFLKKRMFYNFWNSIELFGWSWILQFFFFRWIFNLNKNNQKTELRKKNFEKSIVWFYGYGFSGMLLLYKSYKKLLFQGSSVLSHFASFFHFLCVIWMFVELFLIIFFILIWTFHYLSFQLLYFLRVFSELLRKYRWFFFLLFLHLKVQAVDVGADFFSISLNRWHFTVLLGADILLL